MKVNIECLEKMRRDELLIEWQKLFKTAPAKSIGSKMMMRILAYEYQAKASGHIDKRTKKALKATSSTSRQKLSPISGTKILREWHGVTHVVEVLENEYLWQGQKYKSLSAIAKAITGAHWSGPRFFGLKK